jgi:hypothetical protein
MYLVNRFFPPALLGASPVKAKFVSIAILVSEGKLTRHEIPTRRRTARIPFPLPVRFKELLQRGVPPAILTGLDASWCSGTSWYFLCMFGLSPVYQLLLGDGMSGESSAGASPATVPRGRAKHRFLLRLPDARPGLTAPLIRCHSQQHGRHEPNDGRHRIRARWRTRRRSRSAASDARCARTRLLENVPRRAREPRHCRVQLGRRRRRGQVVEAVRRQVVTMPLLFPSFRPGTPSQLFARLRLASRVYGWEHSMLFIQIACGVDMRAGRERRHADGSYTGGTWYKGFGIDSPPSL